jgi:hypothetical protein
MLLKALEKVQDEHVKGLKYILNINVKIWQKMSQMTPRTPKHPSIETKTLKN